MSGDDLSVMQLFAEKWDNFLLLAKDLTYARYPLLAEHVSALPDNADDAVVLIATYMVPMRIFVDTRAEAELLELLSANTDDNSEQVAQQAENLCDSMPSIIKHKLWRYASFFLEVVDTLTTQKPQ